MRIPPESELLGMTTNERLYASGLRAQYDEAVSNKDLSAVRQLLDLVLIDEPSIELILGRIAIS